MRTLSHKVQFCVVGGGLAGMCAAIAAARHGIKTAIIQDRPVFGGNASSEVRLWICGAQGKNVRETGIIEEINLENNYRNPLANWSIWDSILYEKVRFEPNISLFLNCTCTNLDMTVDRIRSVKAWQLTTETWHTIEADIFTDCSGDSILAPLSGAEFRMGREARNEFNESIAPLAADKKTMGMSCLLNVRETNRPQKFIPPKWAYSYSTDDDLPKREHDIRANNFWWIELGGEDDSIHDTEELRDELLKIVFGVWDHVKNHGDHGAENLVLDWVEFLPGKRESRRYIGDYVMTQNDVEAGGRFDDIVAYGGWPMDDHHTAGFHYHGDPTIFHAAPSPFGIPYRCLYSRTIENLFFAGRNISHTHAAFSSSRVMATCAIVGQAVGTAAALAVQNSFSPRGVYRQKLNELQQALMTDDCWLPWSIREISELSRNAVLTASEGNPDPLRNGIDRPIDDVANSATVQLGGWFCYEFNRPETISRMRIVFDSNLNRAISETRNPDVICETDPAGIIIDEMRCYYPLDQEELRVPESLVKAYRIEMRDRNGEWMTVFNENNNYQRLVYIPLEIETTAVRFVPETTWGAEKAVLFAFEVE